jgi:MFS family permease
MTKFMHGSGFGLAKNLQFCLATMLAMSSSWDGVLQITGGVMTAALIAIIIAEEFDDGYRWHRFVIFSASIVIVGIILVILAAIFYPLTGKAATFLHWHAIILCLFVLSIILVNCFAKPESKDDDKTWIVISALAADMLVVFVLWLLGLR